MRRLDFYLRSMAALTLAAIFLTQTPAIHAQLSASTPAVTADAASVELGAAAMQNAAKNGKYLFVYFWKQNDQQTQSMQGVFQNAMGKMKDMADVISLQITDPGNAAIVTRFDVSRAPMPLVLAIAPNGAVTKGLPVTFNEQQLKEAVVSRGAAECLKALQEQKLVLLCVKHQADPNAFRGTREYVQDTRYTASSKIVAIDPADKSEQTFLRSLKVDPAATTGVTVVLTPPGQPVATFAEDATKDQIVEKLTSMSSPCCPGGQCCPGGTCAPAKN